MQIEISDDMINEIVVSDIKEAIHLTLKDPFELYNDEERAYDLIDSMLKVLEHYMTKPDYDEYVRVLGYKPMEYNDSDDGIIQIHSVEENDDGSADVSFTIPEKHKNKFVEEGMKYAVIRSSFNNPSDDELIKWIERGRDEETLDEMIGELNG